MEFENRCRTCMRLVKSSPAELTDDKYGFLAQDLGMKSVPKEHPELQLPQILCPNCNSLIMEFQRFLTKCREVEKYFKSKLQLLSNLSTQGNEESIFVESINCLPHEELECTLDPEDEDTNIFNEGDEADPNFEISSSDIDSLKGETQIGVNTKPSPQPRTKDKTKHCSVCGKSFRYLSAMRDHENMHKGIKPFCCDVCGKCFTQRSHLVTHQALHFGKTVKCEECGKKFARSSELILHNRIHRDQKPFVCDFENCKAEFRRRPQLSNHKAKHTGVRNFRCDICGHSFFNKASLGTHMYAVHSIKYQCEVCSSWFVSPNSIRNHMSTKHDIQMDDVQPLRKIRSHRKRKNFLPAADKADSI